MRKGDYTLRRIRAKLVKIKKLVIIKTAKKQ